MDLRDNLTSAVIAAIVIAAIILMMNPDFMDKMSVRFFNSMVILLRAIDKFTVDYQLMRGVWKDATTREPDSASSEPGTAGA